MPMTLTTVEIGQGDPMGRNYSRIMILIRTNKSRDMFSGLGVLGKSTL